MIVEMAAKKRSLPDGYLRAPLEIEISLYGCVTPIWQHVVLNDWYPHRYHLLSTDGHAFMCACERASVCVRVSVFTCVHTCVYNYGSPSAEWETFLFGRAICWSRPAPFILSIITVQERIEWKNDIQEKRKQEKDKWRAISRRVHIWHYFSFQNWQQQLIKTRTEWQKERMHQTSLISI